ncbi:MAG TPA: N-acetylglutaminylglutamine synthetase, partial [Gammaproteobacteria bacterium]
MTAKGRRVLPQRKARITHRLDRPNRPSVRTWGDRETSREAAALKKNVVVDCGWGRLIFGHTFANPAAIVDVLHAEREGQRDIAFYLHDPHVVLSLAPHELFLDPSHTYRLWLDRYRPAKEVPKSFTIRRLRTKTKVDAVNRIFAGLRMVPVDSSFIIENRNSRTRTFLAAIADNGGAVLGTATGIDHARVFDDPENGSSLWCLAVDPQAPHPGVGEALVRFLAEHFQARGRAFMDLSVMYDNVQAIRLYKKLGFERVPVFAMKRKNPINERLFIGPRPEETLNPYAQIIVDEARRRGIAVEVLDAEFGYFALTHGGRTVVCRESLSEMASAIAMSRCDSKILTRRILQRAGLNVPPQIMAGDPTANAAFLAEHGRIVVKPARGEQGAGVSVDLRTIKDMKAAIAAATGHDSTVILEKCVAGEDLRIVVIGFEMVAAAVRRPPQVVGDGRHSVSDLIEKQSRRRQAATGGESVIPLDEETRRCVRDTGFAFDDVPDPGVVLTVRKTANLHTGGTIHDVTDRLHPALASAAVRAARALDIPVVGLDFL